MHRSTTVLLAIGLLLGALTLVIGSAQAQSEAITYCGEERYGTELRFKNPDLNPSDDPAPDSVANDPALVEASWKLFPQFQAVVNTSHENAPGLTEIASFWFGFGPVKETADARPGELGCQKPWKTGIQLESYRSDPNPDDGFFVPINTAVVPDGTYGFVLYACTAQEYAECQPDGIEGPDGEPVQDSNLVAAVWGEATVDNAHSSFNLPGYDGRSECGRDDNECKAEQDFIKPWPNVLPGDGRGWTQPYADECSSGDRRRCLTFEFAETLDTMNGSQAPNQSAIRVWVNGIERTSELQDWTPPERDDDFTPGNDGEQSGHPASDCSSFGPAQAVLEGARLCDKVVWGDGFKLDLDQQLEEEDEVRIWARDRGNNTVEKIVAFEDATRGGVIPEIDADVDVTIEPKERQVRPGDAKTFEITVSNTGSDTAHTFPEVDAPNSIDTQLSDNHVDVAGNSNETVTLTAGPKEGAEETDYGITVAFSYTAQSQGDRTEERVASGSATVVADSDAELSGTGGGNGSDDTDTSEPDSLPAGFERDCADQGDLEVCFLYPGEFTQTHVDDGFTFEVRTAGAGGHDASAGSAELTMQYLDASGQEKVAEDQTYEMAEESTGVYRTDVQLRQLAPMLHAVFDSDKTSVTMMIRQPTEDTDDPSGGAIPGFGVASLVGAGAAALAIRRRCRGRDRRR